MSFYLKILRSLLNEKKIGLEDKILVTCGGPNDRDAFFALGFKNVTISNLDYHWGKTNYEPYTWLPIDAEDIDMPDESVDWVFVAAGLHHCASPHKAVCEMLRVAKKGICAMEARDSLLMNAAIKLGLVPDYELETCAISGGKWGGIRYSHIPNFVYRWTELEVKKTVNTYLPAYNHQFIFYYGMAVPVDRLAMSPSLPKRAIAKMAKTFVPVFEKILPKQCNNFGFAVVKNVQLQPWLIKDEDQKIVFNNDYAKKYFNVDACTWQ